MLQNHARSLRDSLGGASDLSGRFIWASDFPHSDARYPGVVDELREHNSGLADDARRGLFGLNALEMYHMPVPTPQA